MEQNNYFNNKTVRFFDDKPSDCVKEEPGANHRRPSLKEIFMKLINAREEKLLQEEILKQEKLCLMEKYSHRIEYPQRENTSLTTEYRSLNNTEYICKGKELCEVWEEDDMNNPFLSEGLESLSTLDSQRLVMDLSEEGTDPLNNAEDINEGLESCKFQVCKEEDMNTSLMSKGLESLLDSKSLIVDLKDKRKDPVNFSTDVKDEECVPPTQQYVRVTRSMSRRLGLNL